MELATRHLQSINVSRFRIKLNPRFGIQRLLRFVQKFQFQIGTVFGIIECVKWNDMIEGLARGDRQFGQTRFNHWRIVDNLRLDVHFNSGRRWSCRWCGCPFRSRGWLSRGRWCAHLWLLGKMEFNFLNRTKSNKIDFKFTATVVVIDNFGVSLSSKSSSSS